MSDQQFLMLLRMILAATKTIGATIIFASKPESAGAAGAIAQHEKTMEAIIVVTETELTFSHEKH